MPRQTGPRHWSCPAQLLRRLLLICVALLPNSLTAGESRLCDLAAGQAARESGVPYDVLLALTRTETGRRRDGVMEPWPWTVNMEGKGLWFDTPREAMDYVTSQHAAGARSYDIGCFQINYRWHGENFTSLQQMMDPLTNARYAAQFLRALHAESGSWSVAAGAFHSRTQTYATRYRARFDAMRAALADVPLIAARMEGPDIPSTKAVDGRSRTMPAARRAKANRFPLLIAPGDHTRRPMPGSLVALSNGAAQPLRARSIAPLLAPAREHP